MLKDYFNKKNIDYNILIILSFLLFSYLSVCLLLHTHILFGAGDMQFHARRLSELRMSFNHLDFFPKYSFNEFHGSAIMSMYPQLNLLPLIIFSYFIKSKILLFYISFIFCIFLLFLISYYSSLGYSKSFKVSYLFSLFYGMSTLYLDYGFSDMDIGVLSVLTFLPLILFGFIYLLKYNKWMELSIGMSLILFSHVLSVFIISAFLFVWLIFNFKIINKCLLKQLFKAIILTLCTTSLFWVPFMHVIINNMGKINRPSGSGLYGTRFSTIILGSLQGKETYGISLIAIIGLLLSLILFKHLNLINKQMSILSLIIVLICSKWFPWNITNYGPLKLFRGFQFTWRFYFLPQILLCYLCATCLVYILKLIKFKKSILFLVILLVICLQIISQLNIINDNYKSGALTKSFISRNTHLMKGNIHNRTIFVHSLDIPEPKNVRHPVYYKVMTNNQYKNLVNPYIGEGTMIDYFPMETLPKVNNIINNNMFYNKYSKKICYKGFNKFSVNISKRIKNRIYLPFVLYNGEHLHVFVNGQLKRYSKSSHILSINGLKKGKNTITIQRIGNYYEDIICFVLSLFSLICYIYIIYYKFNK